MNIRISSLTVLYAVLCVATMSLLFIGNKQLQFFTKPFISVCLFLMYVWSVKKVNLLYSLMLFSLFLTHCFVIFPELYFMTGIYAYLAFNVLAIPLLYKKILLKRSIFNVITFALPFFMATTTIYLLIYKNLENSDIIPVFVFGITACLNGSIVLLNYSQEQDVDSYLIFIGMFSIIATSASGSVYKYGGGGIIFYHLLILLDFLGQYALCRGIIMKQQKLEEEVF